MKSTKRGSLDLHYADGRARGKEVSKLKKSCLHNNGKRLRGNVFYCMRCGAPRGFFRAPKAKGKL